MRSNFIERQSKQNSNLKDNLKWAYKELMQRIILNGAQIKVYQICVLLEVHPSCTGVCADRGARRGACVCACGFVCVRVCCKLTHFVGIRNVSFSRVCNNDENVCQGTYINSFELCFFSSYRNTAPYKCQESTPKYHRCIIAVLHNMTE